MAYWLCTMASQLLFVDRYACVMINAQMSALLRKGTVFYILKIN